MLYALKSLKKLIIFQKSIKKSLLKYDSKKEIKCHNLCMVPIIWLNHEGYSLLSNSPLKFQTQKSPIVRSGSFVLNDGGEGGLLVVSLLTLRAVVAGSDVASLRSARTTRDLTLPLILQAQKSPIIRPGSFVINDGGEGGIRTHLFRGF